MPDGETATPSRRAMLGLAACAARSAAFGYAPIARAEPAAGGLGALAAAKGLMFGASFAVQELDKPTGALYAEIYRRDAAIITTEIELKLHELRRRPGPIDFSGSDRFFDFATANGLLARGHTLIWHDYLPAWIKALPPKEAGALLEDHVAQVMRRYRGRAHSYDVVNEPIAPWDRLPDNLRAGPFLSALGEHYITRSFELARAADPGARLVLNEAQMEAETPRGLEFRASFLALLKRLKARGTPIDAIGFQSHLAAGTAYDFRRFADYIAGIADLGYDIYLTELDVDDHLLSGDIARRDDHVARLYRAYLGAVLKVPAVKLLTLWQLADSASWLQHLTGPTRRRPARPLLYDAEFVRKPAWHAVAEALLDMPAR